MHRPTRKGSSWRPQVMSPTVSDNRCVSASVRPADGVGATAGAQPIASDGVGATAMRPIDNIGGWRQPTRCAMTQKDAYKPDLGRRQISDDFGTSCVDSLASTAAEHRQRAVHTILRVTENGLRQQDEVAAPRDGPPPLEHEGSTPTKELFREQISAYRFRPKTIRKRELIMKCWRIGRSLSPIRVPDLTTATDFGGSQQLDPRRLTALQVAAATRLSGWEPAKPRTSPRSL